MTAIEKAELTIQDGTDAEFEASITKALPVLRGAAGCSSVSLAKGVERPSTYLLLVEWGAVEDHVAFTQTPEFGEFVGAIKDFLSSSPGAEHFHPLTSL